MRIYANQSGNDGTPTDFWQKAAVCEQNPTVFLVKGTGFWAKGAGI
jgi:hypothetical protein